MEKTLRFADVRVGEELESVTVEVTGDMVGEYGEILGDKNPYYARNEDFAGPIGPPSMASILASKPFDARYNPEPGGIHAKQEFEFHNPILPGTEVRISGKVVDKYEKRGRKYIVFETRIEDEEGRLLVKSKSYSIVPR